MNQNMHLISISEMMVSVHTAVDTWKIKPGENVDCGIWVKTVINKMYLR